MTSHIKQTLPNLSIASVPCVCVGKGSVSSSRVEVFGAALRLHAVANGRDGGEQTLSGVERAAQPPLSQHDARQAATIDPDFMQHCRFTIGPAIDLQLAPTARACTVAHTSSIGREKAASAQPSSTIDRLRETRFRFRVSMRATAELATQYGHQNTAVPGPAYSLYFGL